MFGYRFPVLALLLLLCAALIAQTQVLPSVEIGSDTAVKAPLIKKPVSNPGDVPADSIPPRVPPVFALKHKLPSLPQGTIRPLRLDLGTGTDFETKLSASFYPSSRKVPLLRVDADLWVPRSSFSRATVNASAQTNFTRDLRFNHLLSWQRATAADFSSGALSYGLANHHTEAGLSGFSFSDLYTDLTLEGGDQNLAGTATSDFALGFRHSHRLDWQGHQFTNRLVLQDTAFGLSAQYRAPWLARHLPELELGLMTDFIHILPAVDFHKRFLLGPGRYLEISNRTEFQSRTLQQLREQYPWTVLPDRERVVMTPLNFSLSGWQAFNAEDALIQLLGIHQGLRFSYNQPQLYVRDVLGQTYLRPTDIFSYRLGADSRLLWWDWKIAQEVELNLEYLQDDNWRRRPFSPILSSSTEAAYSFGELDLSVILQQLYWRLDEFDQPLPAVFDLGLGLQYPVRPELRLKASLNNIFNSYYQDFGNIPERGRTFRISFSYLPLR